MYTIYNYDDLKKIKFDRKLIIELKKEIKNIYECVGSQVGLDKFDIEDYGKITVISNEVEFKRLIINQNDREHISNMEAEQWIIDNSIYYIINGVTYNDLFIKIIVKEEIYKTFDIINKYYIESRLKKIKSSNGRTQILSY